MGIKQLYNDHLRKLPNEYEDVSVMTAINPFCEASYLKQYRITAASSQIARVTQLGLFI